MSSHPPSPVIIQTFERSVPSTPSWFGEVAIITQYLQKLNILPDISERVRFARRRFGHHEIIDFLAAVLFGYSISGQRTLEAFYERLQPFAVPFMAVFDRDQLPARSTLSRFLAALPMESIEALRALFLDDLLARPLTKEGQRGELRDRAGGQREVFDIDGTREAALQRPLPKGENLPPPNGGWMRSVLLATRAASVGRWFVPAPPFRKSTPLSGPAVSETEATGSTERNWHPRWRPSVAISLRTACLKHVPCWVGWTLRLRGGHGRSGWALLRDAGQRLRGIGPSNRPGATPLAS